MVSRPAWR